MRRLLMIVNDAAGTSQDDVVETARQVLAERAHVDVVRTSSMDDLTSALAAREDAEVVVCGGDGSLHAVLTALCLEDRLDPEDDTAPVVGLVPLGTGNDFARAVSIPTDVQAAAGIVLDGPLRPIDVIRDDADRVIVNAVHVGAGDEAGRLAKPWKERLGRVGLGPLGYVVGTVMAGARKGGWKLRVTVDGTVVSDGQTRLMQVGMANGTSIGGGAEIAPGAAPGDGLGDVVIAEARTRAERLRYALRLKSGRHGSLEGVRRLRGSEVRVESMTGRHFGVNADGELLDPVLRTTWRVQPAAYRLHVPAGVEPTVPDTEPPA